MVLSAKDSRSGQFVCYQSNAISIELGSGRVTPHHDPKLAVKVQAESCIGSSNSLF